MTHTPTTIIVEITVNASAEEVWKLWTTPADIMIWNNPAKDWYNELVEVDLKNGGEFLFKMRSKNGNEGFDYCGRYDKVTTNELIELTTTDGRKTINQFVRRGHETTITETFEADANTPIDLQREFCQSVLNNFKNYAESRPA
jgi:uncharacterized protein YndB with AHSA1/START domain